MHSSRACFSSLQTQQGFTFSAAAPGGLFEMAAFVGCMLPDAPAPIECQSYACWNWQEGVMRYLLEESVALVTFWLCDRCVKW